MDADLRERIMARDKGCVARFAGNRLWLRTWPMLAVLPNAGPCRDSFGHRINPKDLRHMTIDEVKIDAPDQPGSHFRMAKKAGYSMDTCVTACPHHHVFGRQWMTMQEVREALRLYIEEANRRYRR